VWIATRDGRDEEELALKCRWTTSRKDPGFLRFLDEIAFNQRLKDEPGVLPVFDSATETDRRTPAWMAMPIAIPVRAALGDARSLLSVVEAIASYAATLARLADLEVSHRDLRPENLYKLRHEWRIGDFGLVDFPGKRDLTARNASWDRGATSHRRCSTTRAAPTVGQPTCTR
jgi:serine/threonine protein kinase